MIGEVKLLQDDEIPNRKMLQKYLSRLFSKSAVGRKMAAFSSGAVTLATDIGLKRNENQDRVATLSFSSSSHRFYLAAVADGMGGMKSGEASAIMTLSSFFFNVLENMELEPEVFLRKAIEATNNAVFKLTGGNGGSTISALLIQENGDCFTINIGDSRIYAKKSDSSEDLVRLSVDDSLADAFGGQGRELLQFVGMGEGIEPHISRLKPDFLHIYLMTDGVYYIEPVTMSDIIAKADSVIQIVERLIAVSRWCGGPDNASICAIDLKSFDFQDCDSDNGITLFDPFGMSHYFIERKPYYQLNNFKKQRNNLSDNSENLNKENKTTSDTLKDNQILLESESSVNKKNQKRVSRKKYSGKNEEEKANLLKVVSLDETNSSDDSLVDVNQDSKDDKN